MALFADYDRAGLDAQYNLRARVPDFAACVARWAAASAAARRRWPCRGDLAYGPSPAERLDLFLPPQPAAAPLPVHLFLHGGFWQAMDRTHFAYLADLLLPAGIACAVAGYALAPAVPMAEIVRQARAAAAWLWREAPALGLDRRRISVSGHSAGGHLATLLLLTDWPAFAPDLPAAPLAAGFSLSGIYELEPLRLSFHNRALRLEPADVLALSPRTLLPGRPSAPPLLLAAGGAETDEFLRQQADFAAAWRGRGWPLGIVGLPGRDHFQAVDDLADPASPAGGALLALALAARSP